MLFLKPVTYTLLYWPCCSNSCNGLLIFSLFLSSTEYGVYLLTLHACVSICDCVGVVLWVWLCMCVCVIPYSTYSYFLSLTKNLLFYFVAV